VGGTTEVLISEGSVEDGEILLSEVPVAPVRQLEEEEDDRNFDSGRALQLPAWDGHPLVRGVGRGLGRGCLIFGKDSFVFEKFNQIKNEFVGRNNDTRTLAVACRVGGVP